MTETKELSTLAELREKRATAEREAEAVPTETASMRSARSELNRLVDQIGRENPKMAPTGFSFATRAARMA